MVDLTEQQIAEIRASNESLETLAGRYGTSIRAIKRHRVYLGCLTNRDIREHQRLKQRARDVRKENERQLRAKLRAEIGAICWS